MRIQRTIPPTAAPMSFSDYFHALRGLFGGSYIKILEDDLKRYFGVKYVFLVSSGKASLFLILNALHAISPEKKKVIIPAYTCFSVPSAIQRAGLEIILCDIDRETLDFEESSLQKKLVGDDILCVVPTHLFGIPSKVDHILGLCQEKGIFVVEDAAQAMGVTIGDKKLGTIGDIGFFSLGRGKNITCGSGGIIVTNSDPIALALEKFYRNLKPPSFWETMSDMVQLLIMTFFIHPFLYWIPDGLPFLKLGETFFDVDFSIKKLSRMKAAYLQTWEKHLIYSNTIRQKNAKFFAEQMGLNPAPFDDIPFLRLPVMMKKKGERDSRYAYSKQKGMGVSLMYPSPVSQIKELRGLFEPNGTPMANQVSEKLLTFPTHYLLNESDKKKISDLFRGFFPALYIPHPDGEGMNIGK